MQTFRVHSLKDSFYIPSNEVSENLELKERMD